MRKILAFIALILASGAVLTGCFPPQPGLRAIIRTEPNPPRGPYPLTVRFDSTASGETTAQRIWTIFKEGEEGSLIALEGLEVTYTFKEQGKYIVYLEIRTESGTLAQTKVEVDVRSQPPIAAFSADPYPEVQQDMPVTFDASNSRDQDGQVIRYFWNFGDGIWRESTTPTIQHTYNIPDTYTVVLVVEDDCGDRSEPKELAIRVVKKGCGGCP